METNQKQPQQKPLDQKLEPVSAQGLTVKEQSLCMYISEVNMIRQFPLAADEIETWSKTITRLVPDVDPEVVGKVLDKYITGEWEYDNGRGITNIILGIKEITENRQTYYVAP